MRHNCAAARGRKVTQVLQDGVVYGKRQIVADSDQFFFGFERQSRISSRQRQISNLVNGRRLGRCVGFRLTVAGIHRVQIAGLRGLANLIGQFRKLGIEIGGETALQNQVCGEIETRLGLI